MEGGGGGGLQAGGLPGLSQAVGVCGEGVFIAEENKSEMRREAAAYIARCPSHFVGLWWAS